MLVSNQTLLANRTEEISFFKQMVKGQVSTRILLLEAPTGYGKTKLLANCKRFCPSQAEVINIDLKNVINVPYFFNDICEFLGAEHFPNFTGKISNLLNPQGANINDNKTLGTLDVQIIQLALGDNEFTQQMRLKQLQDAFVQDMRSFNQQLIFFLDTFEAAGEFVEKWIDGFFLKEAVRRINWLIVIAGQKVPSPENIIWGDHACKICLEVIDNERDWYKFSQDAGLPFSEDAIKMAIRILKGKPPKLIREALEAEAKEWGK